MDGSQVLLVTNETNTFHSSQFAEYIYQLMTSANMAKLNCTRKLYISNKMIISLSMFGSFKKIGLSLLCEVG